MIFVGGNNSVTVQPTQKGFRLVHDNHTDQRRYSSSLSLSPPSNNTRTEDEKAGNTFLYQWVFLLKLFGSAHVGRSYGRKSRILPLMGVTLQTGSLCSALLSTVHYVGNKGGDSPQQW